MRNDTAKHILISLLAEKNVLREEDADMRELIAGALDCELLPGGLTRSLEKIFTTAHDEAINEGSSKADETNT